MGVRFFIGTYDTTMNVELPEVSGIITLKPWELKHVTSYSESTKVQATTLGFPDKPADCAYIYDVGGAVREFTIEGIRYDAEEQISNVDFLWNQFNRIESSFIRPFSDIREVYYCIGLEWLTSTLQSTMRGYVFRIENDDDEDGRVYSEDIPSMGLYGEEINIGITSISCNFNPEEPGIMQYSITFVERKEFPQGPAYRQYISDIEEIKRD